MNAKPLKEAITRVLQGWRERSRAQGYWHCGMCVWSEVTFTTSPDTYDLIICRIDATPTDIRHLCDNRESDWEEFWDRTHNEMSGHQKAALLHTKLTTYREAR